jgi:hypothetical protein
MVNGIGSQNSYDVSQIQQMNRKPPSAEDMFQRLTNDIGGDGKTISKEALDSYISDLESGTDGNKGKLGFLKQLSSKFDQISGGKDNITVDDLKNGRDILKPQGGPQGAPPPPDFSKMFDELSSKIGSDDDSISIDELEEYLEKIKNNGSETNETKLVSKLIEDFDSISEGTGAITADNIQNLFNQSNPRYQWQDPSTITSDQLQPPIDIKV